MSAEQGSVCRGCGWPIGKGAEENPNCGYFHHDAAYSCPAVDFRPAGARAYPSVDESDSIVTAILDEAFDCGTTSERVEVHRFGANRLRAFLARERQKKDDERTREILAIKAALDGRRRVKDAVMFALGVCTPIVVAAMSVAAWWVLHVR